MMKLYLGFVVLYKTEEVRLSSQPFKKKFFLNKIKLSKLSVFVLVFALAFTSDSFAANVYSFSCPECNYSVSLRTGQTKMDYRDYSVYYCAQPQSPLSLHQKQINSKNMTSDQNCNSKLVPININDSDQICPICNKGKLIIKHMTRAC